MIRKTNIAVLLDIRHKAAYELTSGILRYAAAHRNWSVRLLGNHPSNGSLSDDKSWHPDGIIIDRMRYSAEGLSALSEATLRGAIFIGTIPPPDDCRFPFVHMSSDNRQIAESAASAFIQHGLRNFAFIGSPKDEKWSVERARYFRAAIRRNGMSVSVFTAQADKSPHNQGTGEDIPAWLHSLPKPCGIFAAYDQRALHVLDICKREGIPVPEQLQVIGVDNEDYICENTTPTLSSIPRQLISSGYKAAALLDKILENKRRIPRSVLIPAEQIVERMSTSDFSCAGSRVARAREYIRKNATTGIGASSVVKQVGGSLRLLEMQFKKLLSHSISEEINLVRFSKVTELLTKSTVPIGSIARQCGFQSDNYLKNAFRQRFGTSMSRYRQTHLASNGFQVASPRNTSVSTPNGRDARSPMKF